MYVPNYDINLQLSKKVRAELKSSLQQEIYNKYIIILRY